MTASTQTTPTSSASSTRDADIRAVLREHAAAHAARDVGRLLALYATDAVSYTLAPPLQQGPTTPFGTPQGLQGWFGTFAGPIHITYRDPAVCAGEDVAFIHCLTSMTATPAGADSSFTMWFRSTFGLRQIDGRWLIVHRHESTPFHMDGTFKAAVELQP